jgi:hypothetical protein
MQTLSGLELIAGAARVGGTAPTGPAARKRKVFLTVKEGSIRYFAGAPNHLLPGASALLKPKRKDTTILTACAFPASNVTLLENRGLARDGHEVALGLQKITSYAARKGLSWDFAGAPSRIRTCGLLLRRQPLYPLSYRGRRDHSVPG